MKQVGGVWLPDHETHLVKWMTEKNQVVDGKLTYQLDKQLAAYRECRQLRHAIDIGGHCGLWSVQMIKRFKKVTAFEPVAEHRDCYRANILQSGYEWREYTGLSECDNRGDVACAGDLEGVREIALYHCAIGETEGSVRMRTAETSSGDTTVAGEGDIPLRCLDVILPAADDVDFIKLDCEGYELFALRGAEGLIRRNMPVICVEQKPGKAQQFDLPETAAVEYLKGLGYKVARHMSGDYIMVPA